jgi:hypothetical protein
MRKLVAIAAHSDAARPVKSNGNWASAMRSALDYGAEELRLEESLKDIALIAQALKDMAITEYRLGWPRRAGHQSRAGELTVKRQELKSPGYGPGSSSAPSAYGPTAADASFIP